MIHAPVPGPYRYHPPIPGQGIRHYIIHNDEQDIAEVYDYESPRTGEAEATARLLAASRALWEALRELVEVGDLRGDTSLPHPSDDPITWTARMQEAWDAARQVLGTLQVGG